MNIQELKKKSSEQLISQAEELGVENASTLRKQEILFAILKKLAEKGEEITGIGVLQLLQYNGFIQVFKLKNGFFIKHLIFIIASILFFLSILFSN